MITYPTSILPCPDPGRYSYTKVEATERYPALQGRPRHELKDINAVYLIDMSLEMVGPQLGTWQTFWDAVDKGVDWWYMNLMVDGIQRRMEVHATGPWTATDSGVDIQTVQLSVEAIISPEVQVLPT